MSIVENPATYIFEEKDCNVNLQQKYETLMCLGNGYIGMRSSFCEEYSNQNRLTLIAGLYDHQPNEVEELFPLPDTTKLTIAVNGMKVGPLSNGSYGYFRTLNVKNGLLTYAYNCNYDENNVSVSVTQRRFVSLDQLHLTAFETVIVSDRDAELSIDASIDNKQTLSGTQHSFEEERVVLENDTMWYGGRAVVAGTQFRISCRMRIFVNGDELCGVQKYATTRRFVGSSAKFGVKKGDEVRIVRYALYYTQNDAEWGYKSAELIKEAMLRENRYICAKSFDELLVESEKAWAKRWANCDVFIDGDDTRDTLKTRLGIYHSIIMCPAHDDRVSIAAKGLTGPGYAGHVFWDCELFNLPFFTYTDPDTARKLCTYRYRTLNGARRKAKEYGFKGAMYPWESASLNGDEQCPLTGTYNQDNTLREINCGKIEHHVVCDVAYGLYNYVLSTDDDDFMQKYCLEILFETANFWQSRIEYIADKDRYEILNVIGPDEYKDHVDNNAYTNYMAAWNMRTALEEAEKLRQNDPDAFFKFDRELGLCEIMENIKEKLPKLYLPQINEDGLLPQDDAYLNLPQIDLTKYKNSGINRHIYRDYSVPQISKIMVSKQADVIQLVTLMPDLFPADVVKKNFEFYESKCLHDSSLSLSAYAMVAAKLIDVDMALNFFRGALNTDFSETISNSNAGIHAANCGGIWQCVAFGFAGIKANGNVLNIEPVLPSAWNKLSLNMLWHGAELKFTIDKKSVTVVSANGKEITLSVYGKNVTVKNSVTVDYKV